MDFARIPQLVRNTGRLQEVAAVLLSLLLPLWPSTEVRRCRDILFVTSLLVTATWSRHLTTSGELSLVSPPLPHVGGSTVYLHGLELHLDKSACT